MLQEMHIIISEGAVTDIMEAFGKAIVQSLKKRLAGITAVFRGLFVCLLRKNWFVICGCSFGHLILRKMIEIVATRWQILRLKCTKIDFGWGSSPDPAGGAYSAPPDHLAGF